MNNSLSSSGKNLIVLASSISILISENLPSDDTALFGALFTAIGDNLALISTAKANSNISAKNDN